jgi:PIN domain nuclease of toxin-antitoxin system
LSTNYWRSAGPKPSVSSAVAADPTLLDASAILALLFEEPGAEVVRAHLRTGIVGAANLAKVLAKLSDHGLPVQEAARAVAILGLDVAPMTDKQARSSAAMRASTRAAGLSLGDRACLALARELDARALTADCDRANIAEAVGVAVQVIR